MCIEMERARKKFDLKALKRCRDVRYYGHVQTYYQYDANAKAARHFPK